MKNILTVVLFVLLALPRLAQAGYYPHSTGWERQELRQRCEHIKRDNRVAHREERRP